MLLMQRRWMKVPQTQTRENKVGRDVAASQFNVTQLLANLRVPLYCSMQQQHTSGSRIWSRGGGPRNFFQDFADVAKWSQVS